MTHCCQYDLLHYAVKDIVRLFLFGERHPPSWLVAKPSSALGTIKMSSTLQLTIDPDSWSQQSIIIREDSEDSNWPPEDVKVDNTHQRTKFAGLRKHLKVIIMKIILNLGISLFDFGSDTKVGIDLQQGEFYFKQTKSGGSTSEHFDNIRGYHPIWSSLTFILMFIPGLAIGVLLAFSQSKLMKYLSQGFVSDKVNEQHSDDKLSINVCLKSPVILTMIGLLTFCFPLGVIMAQVSEIYLLVIDDTELLKPIQFITNGAVGLEAFLESGPQTILQLYIIFDTKKIFFTQAVSILISLVSLAKTAIMYDFLMYRNASSTSTTDFLTTISYLASVLPLYLFSVYFKIVTIAILAIYLKYLAILPILLSLTFLFRVAREMRFSFADAFILSVTNLTVVCIGPSKSERTKDSRYRFLLISMIINFVILQTSLGLLLYFFNTGTPSFLDSWSKRLLDPTKDEDLQRLNLVITTLNFSGVCNICLILAAKWQPRLNSDRSAGQILKALETEYLEFMALAWEERTRKINQLLTREDIHPEFLLILQHANKRYIRAGSKPLIWSIEQNNKDLFHAVIQQSGVNLNIRDSEGQTPLTEAIFRKNEDMWRALLLRSKVDVNKAGQRGTPLTLAIKMKYEEVFWELLRHEATDLHAVDDNGFTPLALAIWLGKYEFVKTLLMDRRHVQKVLEQLLLTKDMFKGWSPLTMAIHQGYIEVLSYLLKTANARINFNIILPNKFSPLTWAIWKGNHVLFDLILQQEDVDINMEDGWNKTPAKFGMESKRPLIVKALMDRRHLTEEQSANKYMKKLQTALSRAITKNNSIAFGSILIEMARWQGSKVDLNQPDESGETLLTSAIVKNRPHMVRSLLDKNVDVQVPRKDGLCPLQLSLYSTFDVFQQIFGRHEKRGAIPEAASIEDVRDLDINFDNGNFTPLISSIIKNDKKLFQLCLSCSSIDVNLSDMKGRTPLTEAVAFKRIWMLKTLLKREDIDVNKTGRAGWSPLTRAAAPEGNLTLVWLLLQHPQIEKSMVDGRKQTALQSSLMSGDINIIRLLSLGSQPYIEVKTQRRELVKELCSRKDVDVNRPGYAGFTPLNYAQDEIKELLQKVNQSKPQINFDLKNYPVTPMTLTDTQSLRNIDNNDPTEQINRLPFLSRSFSL